MTRYRLKTMVLARMLAEATVCSLFVVIPVALQLSGHFQHYPSTMRAMLICLGIIGILILPWFGFITWAVSIDETGLTTHSLFKTQSLPWTQIKNLTRRSTWSWLRFVVEFETAELSFPVLLNKCDELIAIIGTYLPASAGRLRSSHRVFTYDRFSMFVQFGQAFLSIVFAAVFWCFYAAKMHISHNNSDVWMLLGFCAAITLIFLWRAWMVVTMPESVETTRTNLIVRSVLGVKSIPWTDIKAVAAPMPLLPEGFTLKTNKGSILVGTGMESGDELQTFIKVRIKNPKGPVSGLVDAEDMMGQLDIVEITKRIEDQMVQSQELLQSLAVQQIPLDVPCEINHCFYATTHFAITGLGQNLADQGFEVDVFAPIESEGISINFWTMRMRVSQTPQDAGSDKNAGYMMGIADEYFCVYDGWSPNLEAKLL